MNGTGPFELANVVLRPGQFMSAQI